MAPASQTPACQNRTCKRLLPGRCRYGLCVNGGLPKKPFDLVFPKVSPHRNQRQKGRPSRVLRDLAAKCFGCRRALSVTHAPRPVLSLFLLPCLQIVKCHIGLGSPVQTGAPPKRLFEDPVPQKRLAPGASYSRQDCIHRAAAAQRIQDNVLQCEARGSTTSEHGSGLAHDSKLPQVTEAVLKEQNCMLSTLNGSLA